MVIEDMKPFTSSFRSSAKIRPLIALLGLAAVALLVVPGCSSTSTRASTGEYIDDRVVTTKVKSDLVRDSATPGGSISVDTFKGRVLLSGFVDTAAQKDQASLIATRVDGVKEVLNEILLKTDHSTAGVFIDDSVITTKVKAALIKADGITASDVSVETFRGVVQLSGFVDDAAQKTAAETVAARIDNVTRVVNSLVVK